jgi:hypothetical protein
MPQKPSHWSKYFYRLESWNLIIAVLSLAIIAATAIVIYVQLQEGRQSLTQSRDATSEQLTLQLDDRLSNPINTKIYELITAGAKIGVANGGPITDGQLDDYLATYEILNDAYSEQLISKENLCSMFSDGIKTAASSQEILEYIKEVQKEDPQFDIGIQHLARIAKQCK